MTPERPLKRNARPSTHTGHKKRKVSHPKMDSGNAEGLGVQKIKASLRQTRRLLAKDNLAADVRVETERRLKSLEADLELAERRKQERAYASKYHMVKFFERQKVLRKINKLKRQLPSSDSQKTVESTLYELRVDLNYVLHFPKLEKYVSLFPSASSTGQESTSSTVLPAGAETDAKRREIRGWIRTQMEQGGLSTVPDEDRSGGGPARKPKVRGAGGAAWSGTKGAAAPSEKKMKLQDDVGADDFFDVDGHGSEESEE